MKQYIVHADHPVFKRQDIVVNDIHLEILKWELELAGYENIKEEEIKNKA